jgi:succinoglycan biosynthesis protein ExoA
MSTDNTRYILGQLITKYPNRQMHMIDNPKMIVATGLNAGIREAKGDVIVRIDAHTEYAKDYVRQCLTLLQETGVDNVGGPWVAKGNGYIGCAVAAAFESPFAVGGAKGHRRTYEGPVDTVYLGCWPKKTFERFGLFDEELVRNQDDEHNLRIVRGGGKVWQSPKIRSWYHPRDSLIALFRQYSQYGYWKVRVIQKHRLPASIRHLVPGLFLLAIAILGLLSNVLPNAFPVLLALLGLYGLCVLLASVLTARKGRLGAIPAFPIVFICYHFGYGYGFLRGVLDFCLLRRRGNKKWTELTRYG